jgi:beta-glucuronidase
VAHPEALEFFEKVSETVRECDKTRILGYASLFGAVGNIGHLVDIMGINSYYGWYGTIKTFDVEDKLPTVDGKVVARKADVSRIHALIEKVNGDIPENMPILLTEFGGDSVPGYYSSCLELWSENYHADVVSEYIKASLEHKSVVGTFAFAFSDYSDPSKPLNGRWNGYNLKGMVSYEREIKLPYYAIREAYEKI